MVEYAVCIDNRTWAHCLTLGKTYKVYKELSEYYLIEKDNDSSLGEFKKCRFKPIKNKVYELWE